MPSKLAEIFNDEKLIEKIKNRLPHLFQLAELESSRAGKIGKVKIIKHGNYNS